MMAAMSENVCKHGCHEIYEIYIYEVCRQCESVNALASASPTGKNTTIMQARMSHVSASTVSNCAM